MIALVFLLIALAITGSFITLHAVTEPPRSTHEGSVSAITDHFLTYAWAVGRFVGTQESSPGVPARNYTAPFANNSVPNGSLPFPASYNADNRWSNVVIDGWVTIYTVAPLAPRTRVDFSKELLERSNGSHGVGIVDATREIVSLRHGRTGFFAAPAVPVNAIVMHYKSH